MVVDWYLSTNYSLHILDFNIPQIQYSPICQLNTSPPPQFVYIKSIRKIIQNS